MPQDRTLLFADAQLHVERVRSHAVAPQWSPVYIAPSQRLVLPLGHAAMEFRSHGRTAWVDGLTALCVPAAQAYQLRPCAAQERSSMVVSAAGVTMAWPAQTAGGDWLLSPRALYRLRLYWRRMEAGLDAANAANAADGTAAFLGDALAESGAAHSDGAVGRARRFLATAVPDARPASLNDIADAACSSAFHLARAFRRRTGLSLHQYRLHLRLASALARLDEGERDIAGLAHDLGFCSQSHLGAVFRREIGVTPALARQALSSPG